MVSGKKKGKYQIGTCIECGREREIIARGMCRSCYLREWRRAKNGEFGGWWGKKENRNAYTRRKRKEYYEQWREIIISKFGDACMDCGQTFPFPVYDLHHIKDKKYPIHWLLGQKPTPERIKELDKCVLLCANCHRLRHLKEKEEE